MNGLRYQTTVRYTKQSEDEHCIRTNEQFIVTDASSLTEVEERVMNEGIHRPYHHQGGDSKIQFGHP